MVHTKWCSAYSSHFTRRDLQVQHPVKHFVRCLFIPASDQSRATAPLFRGLEIDQSERDEVGHPLVYGTKKLRQVEDWCGCDASLVGTVYKKIKVSSGFGVGYSKRGVQVVSPKAPCRSAAPPASNDWLARFQLPTQRSNQRLARCHILQRRVQYPNTPKQ